MKKLDQVILAIIFVGVVFCFLTGTALQAHHEKFVSIYGYTASFFGCITVTLLCIRTLMMKFYGRVSPDVEPLRKRLKAGKLYRLHQVVKVEDDNGMDQIAVIELVDGRDPQYFALRVDSEPPEWFTIIEGEPHEVTPPPIALK